MKKIRASVKCIVYFFLTYKHNAPILLYHVKVSN